MLFWALRTCKSHCFNIVFLILWLMTADSLSLSGIGLGGGTSSFYVFNRLTFLFSPAGCIRPDSVPWDVTERRGWVRKGNRTGEADEPCKPPQLHRLTRPCHACPPDSPPTPLLLPSVKSDSRQPPPPPCQKTPSVRSAWLHLSCGSCRPRSWASSWSASGSSGAWCCCTSPSSSEPATRTAPCWGSRSWTSASATSRL